ncbi:ornithine decarboxylase-like isoform X14 [Leptidea sinapis]|uniref:ornithine decarboxylase-like isoform X14 n=1 Tax=Leptidea sinapis TaxID=189913 RepID=UPI0021C3A93A|nr:ornithine decarboxylase-like isoform X14 [Leptidea sinapis]
MLESRKVFVLKEESSEDVARAMIEGGGQKESFFLLDLDEVYHRIQYFKSRLPRVQIFYAMKANDSEQILKMAVYTGLGFDCASPGEIDKVLQLNVNPLSIIFAVPTKPTHWMTYARDVGVRHTTFDTSYELKKIKQYWCDAQLLIRIKVEGDSIYKLGDKFGCDFETEAIHLLDEAAALNLKVVGVAFHVGSGCSSADSHIIGLQRAKALFDHEEKAGRKMNIVDIGGGFLGDRRDRIDQTKTDCKGNLPETTIIWGPSCDSTDRVMENLDIKLPLCSPLDWLVFPIRGAYSFGLASDFSCLQKSLIRSVISSDLWNKIKGHAVYKSNEFVENPVLSEPLPSTCPPLYHVDWHFNNNTLKS